MRDLIAKTKNLKVNLNQVQLYHGAKSSDMVPRGPRRYSETLIAMLHSRLSG